MKQMKTYHKEWLLSLESGIDRGKPYATKTIEKHKAGIKSLLRWSKMPLGKVDTIAFLRTGLANSGATQKHCKYSLRAGAYDGWRSFITFLVNEGEADKGLLVETSKYKPKRFTPAHRPKLREECQDQLIYDYIDSRPFTQARYRERTKLAVFLILEAGLRRDETVNLKWEMIDLNKGFAEVIGKGSKKRTVSLSPAIVSRLKAWKQDFWIPGETVLNGWSDNAFWKSFYTVKRALGLDINIHGLRRTGATRWLENGVDIIAIKYMLGHASVSTTELYLEADAHRANAEMQRMWKRQAK